MTKGIALEIRGLSTGYRGRPISRGIDLPPLLGGKVYSLIGPNAAGKSTLMRSLAGLQPATGSIRLDGRELIGLTLGEHARHVAYMPQTLPQGVALTVMESVMSALRASPAGAPGAAQASVQHRAARTLERVGLLPLAMEGLERLSGGQRQLVSLAQSLAREPRVLLLDEPISALDLHHQMRVMGLVRELAHERDIIVLMVLHDLQVAARWSDGIVVLSQGQVVASGTASEAITPEVLARVYQVQARVEHCSNGMLQVMVDDILRN